MLNQPRHSDGLVRPPVRLALCALTPDTLQGTIKE